MTNVWKDLFASYRKFKAKMVDSPSYEPLGQRVIFTNSSEAEKRERYKEYQRKYYQEHKEKYKEYAKRSRRKHHPPKDKKWLMWMQLAIYNYLVEKTREWVDAPRWTQIARDLGITCAQVYNAVFVLIKKWYVWRYMSWRYYLTKVPEEKDMITANDLDRTYKKLYNKSKEEEKLFMTTEEDYNNLVKTNEEIKKDNKDLQKKVDELRESNIALIQERESKISSLNSEIRDLRNSLVKKTDEFNELKDAVKVLLKYFQ